MMKRFCVLALLALAFPSLVRADDTPAAKLPLDVLLETPISTAAKYDQQMSNVAASATVITSEEIERYGWTSLGEALQAVRGFYMTNDRQRTYVGLRGIGRPTDNSSRLLVLIDGHPIEEPVFGGAPVDTELGIDLGMVEKIEIIRGPGSALYGTHAMLAVINVITKGADAIAGTSVAAIAGSQHERGAVLRIGRQLGKDVEMTASGYWQETNGANLYLPEFDAPETNDGLAKGIDYQDFHRFVLTLRRGGLRLSLASRAATKGIPTAMWGTNFNQDEWVMNGQDVATLDYHRALGANKSVELRGYWDHGRSHGLYPYDAIGIDGWDTKTFGGEARLQWDLTPNHRFTAGSEYANVRRLNYWYKVGDYTIELQRPFGVTSYYLQYEGHPSPRWAVVAGIRRDDSSATANSTNPRAAILFTPNRSTTLKLLYGSAFRSPNIYEAYYTDPVTPWKAHPDLAPETIRTTELALEQRLSPTALLEASAFHIDAAHMIDQQLEPVDQVYWYNNVGSMESNGVEAGLNIRRADGLWYRFSGVLQRTLSDGQPASNSPQFLLKGGISTSPWAPWHAGLDGVYEPGRSTRDGEETKAFLLLNGIVSRQMSAHFRLALSSRNLLNTHYSYPVGPELKPQSIRQNGRTFTLKLTYCK